MDMYIAQDHIWDMRFMKMVSGLNVKKLKIQESKY